jgi:YVTN family beta-propeller protein
MVRPRHRNVQYFSGRKRSLVLTEGSLVGSSVAGYRVEELVGRGGMGEVYRALDTRLGRPVGLKVLAARLAGDERFRERLLRESRLAASLDHPNVIPIYAAGETDEHLFIAMRYVEGKDLKELLRQTGALDPARAIGIGSQVAGALDAAHRRGLVHRDVKPSNVLIDEQGGREHCYLADFGLTQSATDTTPADGSLLGTIDYVAPEAIRGEPLNGRSDQYALGCMLFEALTATVPFARGSDTATIFAHLEETPPAASERRPELPREIDAVLERAMAKDPDKRFASCDELLGAARVALGVDPPATRSRRLALLATIAVAACLAAVAAVAILTAGGGAPAQPTGALVQIDPTSRKVTHTLPLSRYADQVAAAPGRVWITAFRDGTLWRYTPSTGELSRVSTVGDPRDVTLLDGKAYVSADGPTFTDGTVLRYDALTGVRESGVPLSTCAIASGDGVLWTAGCPFVERLSTGPSKLRVVNTEPIPFPRVVTASNQRMTLVDMAVGGGSVWVLGDAADHRLWRLDERTGALQATIDLPFVARAVAYGEGALWVTAQVDDIVGKVDPATDRIAQTIQVGRGASGVATGGGAVWVTNRIDGTVSRIDPKQGRVTATIPVGGAAVDVAFGDRTVWVTTDAP